MDRLHEAWGLQPGRGEQARPMDAKRIVQESAECLGCKMI